VKGRLATPLKILLAVQRRHVGRAALGLPSRGGSRRTSWRLAAHDRQNFEPTLAASVAAAFRHRHLD
jgi:hypothetical protein